MSPLEKSFTTSTPAKMVVPYRAPVLERFYSRVPGSGYDKSVKPIILNICQNVIEVRPPANVSSSPVPNNQQNVMQEQIHRQPTNVSFSPVPNNQQNVSSSPVPNNQENKRPKPRETENLSILKRLSILKKENEQLKKENETLKRQVSLFKQLIRNRKRLNSVLRHLDEKAQEA